MPPTPLAPIAHTRTVQHSPPGLTPVGMHHTYLSSHKSRLAPDAIHCCPHRWTRHRLVPWPTPPRTPPSHSLGAHTLQREQEQTARREIQENTPSLSCLSQVSPLIVPGAVPTQPFGRSAFAPVSDPCTRTTLYGGGRVNVKKPPTLCPLALLLPDCARLHVLLLVLAHLC